MWFESHLSWGERDRPWLPRGQPRLAADTAVAALDVVSKALPLFSTCHESIAVDVQSHSRRTWWRVSRLSKYRAKPPYEYVPTASDLPVESPLMPRVHLQTQWHSDIYTDRQTDRHVLVSIRRLWVVKVLFVSTEVNRQ